MKGAAQLFPGPTLQWGGEIDVVLFGAKAVTSRFQGTGLFAIEVGSGRVFALTWDNSLEAGSPPTWMGLP